ncbi:MULTISPECIES: hypothetical protein [Cryobacterium]|nr:MULTISPECIES: hypothetical protein [Cryobacterium]
MPAARTTAHEWSERMLDIVYVLGVIAVFALIGLVAWGVAKL